MIYKKYGQTGMRVSAVGFGGMRFDTNISNEKNAEMLLYAYEKGINYFDTAPEYCNDQSEDIFGIALKQMQGYRDKWYVSTKGAPTKFNTANKAQMAVEKSLKRLNVDKIDFYHIWCITQMAQYELSMTSGGQYEGLLKCKENGLIDHIVLSSHLQGSAIRRILEEGKIEGILLGINILNFPYRWEAVEAANEKGYGVVVMNPLAGGQIPMYEKELKFLAGPGETPTEAALRFCISCPQIDVVLNGFTTREHIDTACAVADKCRPFSAEDLARLRSNISEKMDKLCTGCGYCLSECPQNIPIAGYMQYYNAKPLFGWNEKELLKRLQFEKDWGMLADSEIRAADCTECRECEKACTQHINIAERMKEVARLESKLKD